MNSLKSVPKSESLPSTGIADATGRSGTTTPIMTYSLRAGGKHSDAYYEAIAAFTDHVLDHAEGDLRPLIEAFRENLRETGREVRRTWPEYLFELLTLGIFWQVYAHEALKLNSIPGRMLTVLAHARQRGGRLKPAFDYLRGVLSTLFMTRQPPPSAVPPLTLERLNRLLDWLEASGEFTEEVNRLEAWRDYFAGLPPVAAQEHLAAVVDLAIWFAAQSDSALSVYTPNVEQFLQETHSRYRWREDRLFCGRQRVEYHLNMVGTEIMNRAFRDTFLVTDRKVVLVPPCMRARSADRCQAQSTPIGARCAGCEPGCRVRCVHAAAGISSPRARPIDAGEHGRYGDCRRVVSADQSAGRLEGQRHEPASARVAARLLRLFMALASRRWHPHRHQPEPTSAPARNPYEVNRRGMTLSMRTAVRSIASKSPP